LTLTLEMLKFALELGFNILDSVCEIFYSVRDGGHFNRLWCGVAG
jgi:hypothetical protein